MKGDKKCSNRQITSMKLGVKSMARARRPALTPDGRENQMIDLAISLAEKQLAEGTASSQVITHFLKLGSSKERLEKEKLKMESELLQAKRVSLQSQEDMKELYKNAMDAMRFYSGSGDMANEED